MYSFSGILFVFVTVQLYDIFIPLTVYFKYHANLSKFAIKTFNASSVLLLITVTGFKISTNITINYELFRAYYSILFLIYLLHSKLSFTPRNSH